MPWNPDQYYKFQNERSAPFDDLLKLVEFRPGFRAIDLGCGSGELTQRLAKTLVDSDVTGIDNSTQMLAKASAYEMPSLHFEHGDLAALQGSWDLIISNAALQWCEDHPRLIPFLYDHLNPGGQLVVQVPSNHAHISHRLIHETAVQEPFRTVLDGYLRVSPVLPIEEYAGLLFEIGAEKMDVFEKVYGHVLENSDSVVEWVSGTALVPYFERLGAAREDFVAVLRAKYSASMPGSPIFYPFKRTFFSCFKAG